MDIAISNQVVLGHNSTIIDAGLAAHTALCRAIRRYRNYNAGVGFTFGRISMRFRFILTVVIAVFILFAGSGAQAANPSFALAFRFDPPFNLNTPTKPVFYLDVCDGEACSFVIKSLAMNCTVQPVAPNDAPAIIGCMVEAFAQPSYPDPNLGLLSRPMNLRIRANDLSSQVFSFTGGRPAMPEVFYNFVITPAKNGFSVSLG